MLFGLLSRPSPVGPYSTRRAVLQFLASAVVVVLLVGGIGLYLLHLAATREALGDARRETLTVGRGVVEPILARSGGRVDADARRALAVSFARETLGEEVSHVKLWAPDGTVLFASEPQLNGRRFTLGAEELEIVRDGGAEAEVSDLNSPENSFERSEGKLLEVYSGVRVGRTRLLFETYRPYDLITANEARLRTAFAPALLAAVVLLVALLLPLVLGLARRLERSRRDREALLRRALDASDRERVRVARELHDGPVQRLSGIAFSLAAAERAGDPGDARELARVGARQVRETVRELRGALTELYPPALHRQGLQAALGDVLAPLRAAGVATTLAVPEALELPEDVEQALFRAGQEAARNALEHAAAAHVEVAVTRTGDHASITVADDGRGFEDGSREGHFGLRLLEDLAHEHGGPARRHLRTGDGNPAALRGPGVIRVVLVDDHPLIRAGLDGLLSATEDVEVVGVGADGTEAAGLVLEHEPDVVLMDLSMPGMDGIEATRDVLAARPGLPVVILTTFSDRERILAAIDAGAVGYQLKDAEPEELLRAVRAAAAGDAPLAPRAARELLGATRSATGPLEALSDRERQVLGLVRQGLANKVIAQRLGIAEKTVKAHLTRVYETIGVADRTSAALWARDRGL